MACSEDSWSRTVLPRFLAAGGDRCRIARIPLEIKVMRRDENGNPVECMVPFALDEFLDKLGEQS
jgi:hypothetical protein